MLYLIIFTDTRRPKRVLVMINYNGGNRTARKDFRDIVEPVFKLAGMSMDIVCKCSHFV